MSKIAFIWYWDQASSILPYWRDGLRAALEVIAKDHEVSWFLDKKIPDDNFDAYLLWGDSNCEAIQKIATYKGKKGICLSTNPTNPDNLRFLDAVFCESTPVLEEAKRAGIRAIKAFGTDCHFFTPDETVVRDIPYFYPATFSPWKRQNAIAHYGKDLLCVGTLQPDGEYELQACKNRDVKIEIGYFPVEKIRSYYNRARHVLIPAIHGSERTVLESLSMDVVPQVNRDNVKAYSYIQEFLQANCTPRDFILTHYSPEIYAKNILKGIL